MKRFPMLLHVTYEEPERDDPYHLVMDGGVFDVNESGKPIALYRLVQVGIVSINKKFVVKKFVDPKPKRKRRRT